MKKYRENELKYYIIACILLFLWFYFKDFYDAIGIWNVLNALLISPVLYILVLLFDSLYSSNVKFKMIFWHKGMPSRTVFEEIRKKGNIPWFSIKDAKEVYNDIYNELEKINSSEKEGKNTDMSRDYQARMWYSIYSKYKDKGINSLDISAMEFRLFRDMNVSTINLSILFALYCLLSKCFYYEFAIFLLLAVLVTNLSARNKGKRWVLNVVSYDIHQMKPDMQQN